jgi:hypothetical protein
MEGVCRLKKFIVFTAALLILLVTAGCGTNDSATFEGMVFAVEENRVLVVKGIESADIPYDEWFEKGNEAIFFAVDRKTGLRDSAGKKITLGDIRPGHEVRVTFSGAVAKSYPGQATAAQIRLLQ